MTFPRSNRVRVEAQQVGEQLNLLVAGELDIETGPQLVALVEEHVRGGVRVRLDLAQVSFLDSSGAKAVIQACGHVADAGGSVAIARPSPMVRQILEVLGVDAVAPIER